MIIQDLQGDVGTFFRYKGKLHNFRNEPSKVINGTGTAEEALESLRAQMVMAMRYGSAFTVDLYLSTPDWKETFTNREIFDSELIFDFEKFRERDNYMKFVKKEEIFSPGGMNNVFYLNEEFTIVLMTSLKEPELIDQLLKGLPNPDNFKKITIT